MRHVHLHRFVRLPWPVTAPAVGLIIFMLAAPPARAQFNAALQGTVTDPSGAAISGATVNLVEESTGVAKSTVTSASGFYALANFLPAATP